MSENRYRLVTIDPPPRIVCTDPHQGGSVKMVRHRLTDQQWELVQGLFPPPARTGRPRRDRREILDGILRILRTGAPWRDLPTELGPRATTWDLFDTWSHDGTLEAILTRLRSAAIDAGLVDRE